jgi:hypothetical protein
MINLKPDYSKCTDTRKEIYWNICKFSKKDTIMICALKNKPCKAWEGYKHEE